MSPRYVSGLGRATDWREALDQALHGLHGARPSAGTGLVYVDDDFAGALDPIVDELVRRTALTTWFGSISRGVFGAGGGALGEGSLAILLTPWDEPRLRFVGGGRAPQSGLPPAGAGFALVHGDRRLRRTLPETADRLTGGAFAVGGITASRGAPLQVLDRPAEDELGALVLDRSIGAVAGISQACVPIGPSHEVSAASGSWLRRLDDRPAYAVLQGEMGDILSRQPERIAGYIHVELAGEGERRFVRPILAVEPRSGEIATAEPLRRGQRLRFVKRDAGAARSSFETMLEGLREDLHGRPPMAALYIASRVRLTALFADPASEIRTVHEAFGPVPLIGFCSDGEIFDSRLHDWSSILVLFT